MPSCAQCGTPNPEGNVFCGSCGTPLSSATTRGDPPKPQQPIGRPSARTLRPQADLSPYTQEKERRKRIEWIRWAHLTVGQKIGRLVLMLIVLGVVVIFGLRIINGIFDALS